NDKNIIALRGTQSIYEWLMDALCIQAPIPLPWLESTSEDTHKKLKLAKAHLGFLTIYAFLNDQIIYATKKFANPKTCYVTGHSLGGALSVLAALFLRINVFLLHPNTIQMYSYAGPRVGDSTFADAYNFLVPHSYRVVNLADLVPMVPPAQIGNYTYEHIGASNQEWSYLNQTGDIGNNHDLEKDYLQALQFKPPVVTNAPRTYPVSGLPR
ncbi:MAG TPA: lipase family protein, partial [Bacillota bacterium]|nr:lipase family protein [Bacillota bacterium]